MKTKSGARSKVKTRAISKSKAKTSLFSIPARILILSAIFLVIFGISFSIASISKAANNGLIMHLNLNETSGTEASDSSRSGNNATLTSSSLWTPSGKIAGAVTLGDSDYMSGNRLDLTNFTLSTWIKTSSATRGDLFMNFDDASNNFSGYGLVLNPGFVGNCDTGGVIGLWVGDLTDGYICTTSNIADGQWHLITATWDNNSQTGKVYIDGSESASGSRPAASLTSSVANMRFGYNSYGGDAYYSGSYDDIRIYGDVLSLSQIQAIYNITAPTITINGSSTVNLTVGDIFTDDGALANDFEGNILTVTSSIVPGPINTSTPALYTITYSAVDFSGVNSSADRIVEIVAAPEIIPPTPTSTPPVTPEPTDPTPPVTVTPKSTSSGSSIRRMIFGSFNPSIAPKGQVLGASTSCGIYLKNELRPLQNNNTEDVIKLQAFLNEYIGSDIPMTGIFGRLTMAALKDFQIKNRKTIIDPWIEKGFTLDQSSGIVATTTLWTINNLVCPSLQLPKPVL